MFRKFPIWLCLFVLPLFGGEDRVRVYGDLLLRLESDWDSHREDGRLRDDRDRARYRARLGLKIGLSARWRFDTRIRGGSRSSQQSPFITFHDLDGNPTGDHDVLWDRWVFQGQGARISGAVGRSELTVWHREIPFWDKDVSVAGFGGQGKLGQGSLSGGFFYLPDGALSLHGHMFSMEWFSPLRSEWTMSLGSRLIRGKDGAEYLRNGNGERDYDLFLFTSRYRPRVDFNLGIEVVRNFRTYDRRDGDYAYRNRDQKSGFKLSFVWGNTKAKHWLLGFYYADVEALAMNAAYDLNSAFLYGDLC